MHLHSPRYRAFTGTRSPHSFPHALQRYFISTAAGSSASAGTDFRPRKSYSLLLHSEQHRARLASLSISPDSSLDCVPIIVEAGRRQEEYVRKIDATNYLDVNCARKRKGRATTSEDTLKLTWPEP